ncbi:hypothetical protein FN846DRAFT_976561 [Sphaerosporella brunnea]|uniref:HAUS augmin-like complex subunit 1 n=1 Tax=Sphaerosporella brunnea TaxID=1250544 RepID=A0A5J5EFP6_9PEZI|nr:hypothetical protein FN846DRAFT_976561 [Sphaerosporella brunnea]
MLPIAGLGFPGFQYFCRLSSIIIPPSSSHPPARRWPLLCYTPPTMTDFDSLWSPAKVFSPTAAKAASLQQKDWAYVDQFLTTRFAPNPVPKFERNTDILKALLALASANEAADEEKALERSVKEKALDELKKRDAAAEDARRGNGEPLLVGVEEHLTPEGKRCLNSVALLSVALGSNSTEPQKLSSHLLALSSQEVAVAQQTLRIDALHSRLQADLTALRETLRYFENGEEYQLPPELAARVTEWTRTSRHLRNKTEDYKSRLEEMAAEQLPKEGLAVPDIIQQEQEVLALKELVLDLESQVKGYRGLPPEKDMARLEVERAQKALEELEAQRERFYDGMIGSR